MWIKKNRCPNNLCLGNPKGAAVPLSRVDKRSQKRHLILTSNENDNDNDKDNDNNNNDDDIDIDIENDDHENV